MPAPDADARRSVAILAYHKIGEPPPGTWPTWNYISAETFSGHLRLLADHGYEIIDQATFRRGLADPDSLPLRTAILTFDDGCASLLDAAAPILGRLAAPAIVFVPTDFIGGQNTFDQGAEPPEKICTWDQLRELQGLGFSVQSHGMSHRAFSDLDLEEQQTELRDSMRLLEQHLGTLVDLFAFPFGDPGQHPSQLPGLLSSAGYRAACRYKGGALELPTSDIWQLPRIAMGPDTDLARWIGGSR